MSSREEAKKRRLRRDSVKASLAALLLLALGLLTPVHAAAEPSAPPEDAFRPFVTRDALIIERAQTADPHPWIRAKKSLPRPCSEVAAVLTDYRAYGRIFAEGLDSARILGQEGDDARFHLIWKLPFPFRNRDAIVAYRFEANDRAALLSWEDAAAPGDPHEGVRIDEVAGETSLQGSDGECAVTYTYYADLGGSFPAWIERRAWQSEPILYFEALEAELASRQGD